MYKQGVVWYADGGAKGDLVKAREASYEAIKSGISADSFSWWGNDGCDKICKGVAGVAYIGSLCDPQGLNTNLNEKRSTHAASGFVSF